jgi:primosomal replication protein N
VNQFRLRASLIERSAPRYTPAGVPVMEVQLHCESEVFEAGLARRLDFKVGAIGLGPVAAALERADLGTVLELEGFIAPKSQRSGRLVLHVTGCQAADCRAADCRAAD